MKKNKKISIAFLAPHMRVAGGARIFLTYADILSKKGYDVTVYARSSNKIRRWVANTLQVGKPTWISKLFSPKVLRVPDFTDQFIGGHDFVVANDTSTARAVSTLSIPGEKKFFIVMHDEALYHTAPEVAGEAYRLPIKKIVISTWLKEVLREKYDADAELLIQPVDTTFFHPVARTKSNDEMRILLLDHPYNWKGTKEGVKMVNELKKKYPQIRLILYGAKKDNKGAYQADEYYFNIPQNKLSWLYSNSDIYLCPSWDEGFGMPPQEAMACGVAVATYDNGGSRDFAFNEKNALVVPRRDEQALQNALERLIQDTELRKRLADEGVKFVRNMATWEEQADKLENIISHKVK